MPLYRFSCGSCGASFDALAGYGADAKGCTCGSPAVRVPTFEAGFVVAGKSIPPDRASAQYEEHRELRRAGWNGDRALELIRKNVSEDKEGRKSLNVTAMNEA